ncbi:endonuclease domain-containing protein [Pseudomonadota bacterium]|nr:endonuclease domain-containing protein [Pseudomonadota bacterium]
MSKIKINKNSLGVSTVINEADFLSNVTSDLPPEGSSHPLEQLLSETHQKAIDIMTKSGDLTHLLNRNGVGGANGLAHSLNPAHYFNYWYMGFPHRSKSEVVFHQALFKINKEILKARGIEHCFFFMPLPVGVFVNGKRVELDFALFTKNKMIGIEVDGDSHIQKSHFDEESRLKDIRRAGFEIFRFRPNPKDDSWAEEAVKSILREIESKRGF